MKISEYWQNVDFEELHDAIKKSEEIHCWVPYTMSKPKNSNGMWLPLTKKLALEFCRDAEEDGNTIHANWDGEQLMIGGGGLPRREPDKSNSKPKRREITEGTIIQDTIRARVNMKSTKDQN